MAACSPFIRRTLWLGGQEWDRDQGAGLLQDVHHSHMRPQPWGHQELAHRPYVTIL